MFNPPPPGFLFLEHHPVASEEIFVRSCCLQYHDAQLCSCAKLLRCLIFIILHIHYVDEGLTRITVNVSQEQRYFRQSGCF